MIYLIYRLNDQFFFILGDISNITFEIWKSLDLPINLFFILQEKLNQVKNQKININEKSSITGRNKEIIIPKIEAKIIQPERMISEHIELPSKEKIDLSLKEDFKETNLVKEQTKQKESTKTSQIDFQSLNLLLESIVSELNIERDSSKIEILKKIHTVIYNIASNPNEEKFKKLKLNSKFYCDFLQPYKSILRFLELINFTQSDDNQSLEYKGRSEEILQVLNVFNKFLVSRSIINTTY